MTFSRRQTFNTAIAASMELLNYTVKYKEQINGDQDKIILQEALESIILILAPIVPHFCHALWNHLGHSGAIMDELWPTVVEEALTQDSIIIVLQVNGKLRDRIEVPEDISDKSLEELALANSAVERFLSGKDVRKVVIVPKRLVNVVAG